MTARVFIIGVIYAWIAYIIISSMRRSALTNSLLRKYEQDEKNRADDHSYWYKIDLEKIDDDIRSKFVQLHEDEKTKSFLTNCYEKSDAFVWQLWHSLAIPFLKMFMTQTNVNGYLERGSMFVYSDEQFNKLMEVDSSWRAESLLDLGAGDGKVTEQMATHFSHVYTTEVATQMQRLLTRKGYTNLAIDGWVVPNKYDVITCLNLLDRCDKPMTLLRDIRKSLTNDGRLIVASVSPYSPYVEENVSNGYKPTETIHMDSTCIEDQVNIMIRDIFQKTGFELVSFSRVPYLCEGDLTTSFYILYDLIFVLRPVNVVRETEDGD